MSNEKDPVRVRTRQIQAEFAEKGDVTGWFEALYSEAAGNNEKIPWADLEPNEFLVEFAEKTNLRGNGRRAMVVGCGLGDDARYLRDLGFEVTAFDISPTAIEWARKLNPDIRFEIADLFNPPQEWAEGFEFVLEIYTIQPLPLEIRSQVIDAIAGFVAPGGTVVVVTRGREDDEAPQEMPWPLSRKDLSQFETHGLRQTFFEEMWDDEDPPVRRFVVEYRKNK
jgi:SAM-dependent methyltransferase